MAMFLQGPDMLDLFRHAAFLSPAAMRPSLPILLSPLAIPSDPGNCGPIIAKSRRLVRIPLRNRANPPYGKVVQRF